MKTNNFIGFNNPNKIEKNIEPILKKNFPRYIRFRNKYLYPLTKNQVGVSNWREDTHPELEQIGMASYGILKSANFIYIRKNSIMNSDFEQSFKNIYFHFGLIFDCVEVLCRNIVRVKQVLELRDFESKMRIPRETLIKKFGEWVEKEYDKKFKDLLSYGKPIMYYPQQNNNYIKLLLKKSLRSRYYKFSKVIKDYRNFFIHNPGIDVFKSRNNFYTIKKELVSKTKNWADLQKLFEKGKDNFINPREMAKNDLSNLLTILNDIWEVFLIEMNSIYDHDNFNSLFKGYKREKGIAKKF